MSADVHSWSCPGCGRRVPLRVDLCHCGRRRQPSGGAVANAARPVEPAPPRAGALALWRALPMDVQALVLAAVLCVAAGLVWLVHAPPPEQRLPALLGYIDAPPPPPAASTHRPPFKLPWWK